MKFYVSFQASKIDFIDDYHSFILVDYGDYVQKFEIDRAITKNTTTRYSNIEEVDYLYAKEMSGDKDTLKRIEKFSKLPWRFNNTCYQFVKNVFGDQVPDCYSPKAACLMMQGKDLPDRLKLLNNNKKLLSTLKPLMWIVVGLVVIQTEPKEILCELLKQTTLK